MAEHEGSNSLATAIRCAALAASLVCVGAQARTIEFAGRTWEVHRGFGGPGPNRFSSDPDSVWVDDQGRLHLTIRKLGDAWFCSEVYTQESLGYGTYRFQLDSDAELYDPRIVVGLFTYLDDEHEIDIELTRQGDEHAPAGNFTVQPYFIPGNMEKFELASHAASTHAFEWRPESIYFQSLDGHYANPPAPGEVIHDWSYTGGSIPLAGAEKLYINFYLFQGVPPSNLTDAELIVTSVGFTTAALVPAPWARFNVVKGVLVGGNLASVSASDDAYLEIDAQAAGGRHVTTSLFEGVSTAVALDRLDLTIDASVAGGGATAVLQLYDFDGSRYVTVGSMPLSDTDLRHRVEVANPGAYVRDVDGHVRARIMSAAAVAHRARIDALRIDGAE